MGSETRYSISEIDAMREAVRKMFGFNAQPTSAEIEDRLRTHMLNGTDPDELAATADEHFAISAEKWRENMKVIGERREAIRAALSSTGVVG